MVSYPTIEKSGWILLISGAILHGFGSPEGNWILGWGGIQSFLFYTFMGWKIYIHEPQNSFRLYAVAISAFTPLAWSAKWFLIPGNFILQLIAFFACAVYIALKGKNGISKLRWTIWLILGMCIWGVLVSDQQTAQWVYQNQPGILRLFLQDMNSF